MISSELHEALTACISALEVGAEDQTGRQTFIDDTLDLSELSRQQQKSRPDRGVEHTTQRVQAVLLTQGAVAHCL